MPALIDRDPTPEELVRFNLIISTATDGTGKNRNNETGGTYPDYSLIEDATAEAFGGRTVRTKDVYNVLIPGRGRAVQVLRCLVQNEEQRFR